MPDLDAEVRRVQNPAFGAVLLAAFVHGFYEADQSKQGAPVAYVFLALPMLLRRDIYEVLRTTKPSLRNMAEKFFSSEYASTDLLLSLATSARRTRRLTSDSLAILLLTGLARMESKSGRLIPQKANRLFNRPDLPDEAAQGRKLGTWFAQLSTFEISSILKVTF